MYYQMRTLLSSYLLSISILIINYCCMQPSRLSFCFSFLKGNCMLNALQEVFPCDDQEVGYR